MIWYSPSTDSTVAKCNCDDNVFVSQKIAIRKFGIHFRLKLPSDAQRASATTFKSETSQPGLVIP